MHHPNASLYSLNENLYDISISGGKLPKKKYHHSPYPPRRVGLTPSLATLNEVKRPGDYYLQKLNLSSLHLPKAAMAKRPQLNVSTSSESKDSDDDSLVGSSPFDLPDSRLSSMTANSLYSTRASDAPEAEKLPHVAEKSLGEEDVDQMSSLILTITLQESGSALDLSEAGPLFRPRQMPLPKVRAASTPNVLTRKYSETDKQPGLSRQNTVSGGSSFNLSRAKTRFFNAKETKERQQLRKKMYEEHDNDDEILTDNDLVFNVPVIKSHGEFYRYKNNTSSTMLSRNDIVKADELSFPFKNSAPVRPCPLPGKLSQSNMSLDSTLSSMPEENSVDTDQILEENEDSELSFSFSADNDGEISRNISDFYTQRSVSYSKLVKMSREQHMVYKLPKYVRSQTSIEDLSLISPEKLDAVDQSRPINLPPKCSTDKAKHSKEFHKVLTSFENTAKIQNDTRKKLGELFIMNQQAWFKLMITVNEGNTFSKKLYYDKEKIRKLNWDSLLSERFRFDYFMKVLTLNMGEEYPNKVRETFMKLEAKYENLADEMRASKDAEFDKIIARVLDRPVYRNFMVKAETTENSAFNIDEFKANFKHLLYLKSLSQDGLKLYHEIFLIPMFLIFFQSFESFTKIYVLIEMFDKNIFKQDLFSDLNQKLSCWTDLSSMSSSSESYKILSKFNNLLEFEFLNSMSIFEIIIQLNDSLPLSLSAPSTPIVAQSNFGNLGRHASGTPSPESTATNSLESLPELNQSSIYSSSSSLSVVGIFLQLLVIYSNSPKSKKQNHAKLIQGFLLTVFKYYHINWNNVGELVKHNRSIRLNNTNDQLTNLKSFLEKWRTIFKKS